jgi:hypothetical protein
MQGGWQPPPGGGSGYGGPPGYGAPPPGAMPQQNPYAAPGAAPGMGGMGMQYGNYEFNELENGIIEKTASRAKLWGWISTVLGALQLLGGSCGAIANVQMAFYVPYGIVMLIVGITFIGVGNSLRSVVDTQGNDIAHMMQALQKLGSAFLIQTITYIATILLAVIVGVLVFFFALAVAATR